jgi:hypothetical protein
VYDEASDRFAITGEFPRRARRRGDDDEGAEHIRRTHTHRGNLDESFEEGAAILGPILATARGGGSVGDWSVCAFVKGGVP